MLHSHMKTKCFNGNRNTLSLFVSHFVTFSVYKERTEYLNFLNTKRTFSSRLFDSLGRGWWSEGARTTVVPPPLPRLSSVSFVSGCWLLGCAGLPCGRKCTFRRFLEHTELGTLPVFELYVVYVAT